MQTIGSFYGINGKKLQRYYRKKLSEFKDWKYRKTASEGLIFPENIGPNLSLDETCLSRSRYLLYKSEHKWTLEQKQRAEILFDKYPDLKQA